MKKMAKKNKPNPFLNKNTLTETYFALVEFIFF